MVPIQNAFEDRSAIRQALAILEQEGVHIDTSDLELDCDLDSFLLEEGMPMRREEKQRSRTKSPSRTRNLKIIAPNTFKTPLNKPTQSKLAEDASVSTSSQSNSSISSSSTSSYSKREIGRKIKRSGSKVRTRRNSPKRDPELREAQDESEKSVRFSSYDHTILVPHILDFTPDEIQRCWMDDEDYRSIRSRSLTLIEMMEDEKKYPISADYMIVNKHLVCVRGLGEKTSESTRELERVQRKLYKGVFRVQEELREEGIVDPEAIRKACRKYSKKSTKTARFVGISDEVNVSSKFG
mmetsp:Transcript_26345/g.57726  ORF Transcript_26345/g.57726 Transcript_26345/m.57726 type:complete len:296 (-) Transcript_26345:90-977(-)|eukprot:CAMPEP_0168201034 /NCGR_PEP_ID=MMETSP0139_2-20121125/23425_1 /TAXON_ID=44445 /ORGANISM="Pseudo-nitzschia australis, Strain 10249 10 AB" /LENGTH=295 /DNA_ID=CAMNT_0008126431 /DNA_START=75 /DNA_END=962 /DNA_ORIENTATION=-